VVIEPAEGEATEVTKLAIGTEGGFQVEPKYDITQVHTLVVMPTMLEIPLPCAELPELVIQVVRTRHPSIDPHARKRTAPIPLQSHDALDRLPRRMRSIALRRVTDTTAGGLS
jgi:hypothetical protein